MKYLTILLIVLPTLLFAQKEEYTYSIKGKNYEFTEDPRDSVVYIIFSQENNTYFPDGYLAWGPVTGQLPKLVEKYKMYKTVGEWQKVMDESDYYEESSALSEMSFTEMTNHGPVNFKLTFIYGQNLTLSITAGDATIFMEHIKIIKLMKSFLITSYSQVTAINEQNIVSMFN